MAAPFKLTRIPTLKTVEAFRALVDSLGIELPCDDAIAGPYRTQTCKGTFSFQIKHGDAPLPGR